MISFRLDRGDSHRRYRCRSLHLSIAVVSTFEELSKSSAEVNKGVPAGQYPVSGVPRRSWGEIWSGFSAVWIESNAS
jgi:hypothetical protein